jgi:hypothetical protein
MQRRLIPLKRDHDTPLLGSSTCFDGSSRGGSDGPLLPSASRINPHKPSRSPALHGRYGRWSGWKPGSTAGKQSGQRLEGGLAGTTGRSTDWPTRFLHTPHHHQTGSATRSGGCHAIAQKGVAKAFCCAGDMMTADGGWERLAGRVACTPVNAPFRGLPPTAPSSILPEVIGRMGRGENPRQGIFPWFWPIGNTLR